MLRFVPLLVFLALLSAPLAHAQDDAVERGRYLFAAGGCLGCHTAKGGALLAGGRALKTPFGTFFGPNITPDPQYGIGGWSDEDFLRALREGVSPEGDFYYPAFPYASFTGMTDADILALKAYIFSLTPVAEPSRDHELDFPYNIRVGLAPWRWRYFKEGPLEPDPAHDEAWNRGAYLVKALVHCGECHTPRDSFGGPETDLAYAGTTDGPEGAIVPNITPDPETGIGDWSAGDLDFFLSLGMLPDGDVTGDVMYEVIEHGTSKLTAADREAIAVFLQALPPIRHAVERKKP
ncbi:MAG: c-type cytochrome [Rhodospirillaceae bacterium]|nr:c-type cytochrome [Rhodospirillaceae bacterium]MBT6118910.1 c-type cytochrome [Rhodospirillaceae bacterium]